ncbi:MAG: autotransporter-associated beta strand repeat-containing protein, partial [bacterium]
VDTIDTHAHAIVGTNNSVLSLTNGGSIVSSGTGGIGYYLPIRLEGGSGGSYTFTFNNPKYGYFGKISGTAKSGGDYTLYLGGGATGVAQIGKNSTYTSYIGSLDNGTGGGTLSIIKIGAGTWNLSDANTYTGTTTLRNGILMFKDVSSFGAGTSAIVIGDSGTGVSDNLELQHASNVTMSRNIVVNNSNSTGTTMFAVRNNLGSPTFSGNITLNRTITIYSTGSGYPTFSGIISGSGGIIKNGSNVSGQDRATLSGTSPNTFTGPVTVNAGLFRLSKSAGVVAIPTDVTVTNGTLQWLASNQIADTATITVSSPGLLNLNGCSETVKSLVIGGVAQVPGTYNSTNTSAYITGTGTLTVTN